MADASDCHIRLRSFSRKTGRRPRVDEKCMWHIDKRKVECFNCHNTGHFARECKFKGSKEGNRQEAGKGQNFKPVQIDKEALMTIDEGQINWVEQTTDEELNHALMAFTVNNEVSMCSKLCLDSYNALQAKYDELQSEFGDQEAALVAHKLAVKKLESQLKASHKQQSSLNEKLNFQANQIFEKDEKLKKYRRIGMKAVKDKDALQKIVDSWFASSKNLWKLIDCGMSSTVKLGKHWNQPQSPSPTVSNASSIVFSICPSNDSEGELGAVSDASSTHYSTCQSNDSDGELGTNWNQRMERELGAGYSFERKPCFVCGSLSHFIKNCDYYEKKMAREAALKSKRVVHFCRVNVNTGYVNVNTGYGNVNSGSVHVNSALNLSLVHPLKHMEHRGIFNSGCSGHMTGNRAHLEDYQELSKVGSVTFGGSKGSISGKGTIRLGNLVFDDVAFCEELDILIFSPISDMSFLKFLRLPKMYTFEYENVVASSKGYTCLLAKASSDEAKLWHRRLGHLNFKNLNKLVKDNLVRGLPSKSFKNDHTCVACQKGKQHKASCKAKIDRYVTHPLHTLHMDLFGPTSVRSINHASYCLVITDDYSRFCWVFFLAKKDETSDILKTFIRQIENQLNQKVKIIRSDNGTEFKNRVMLEFCGEKGIKQEFSNARTPQQNGVAERMNRTLIEAARTMLADSHLPTTFWAEAVNTACYTFNRVRVTKPQNKTPYELLFGHKPILSYIRPFGCHVTILNTLSPLGKFDGKSDEGFLVGYSVNSKAFRVYNLVTKRVEVNLHVNFLEEKPNVQGIGHRWMFDLDYLTDSMNYIPVSLQNQANPAGSKEVIDIDEQTDEAAELMVVSSTSRKAAVSENIATKKTHSPKQPSSTPISKSADDIMAFRKELDALALKHLGPVHITAPTSTNPINTGSGNLNTGFEQVTPGNMEAISPSANHVEEVFSDADDDEMPEIRIYDKSSEGIFEQASFDDDGIITDFNNLPDEVDVPTNPTLRIHNAHPQSQILGDPNTPVQTRSSLKKITEAHALVSYIQAQQRSNHKDQQHCLFACFLSQFEPRKVSEALEDGSWVEAMQEELLQFKLQQVWVLVDLPNGAKVIGTKWVYRNKKDERGVVVRNKARLVAQGHRQEEGIDYDEVFAPKVVKALYGLHQAPRVPQLVMLLCQHSREHGYKRGTIDKTLFIRRNKKDIMLVQVYVDDIIFGSTNKSWCDEFEALMQSRFQMSSMGELTFFLGLQVKQNKEGIFISQDKGFTRAQDLYCLLCLLVATTLLRLGQETCYYNQTQPIPPPPPIPSTTPTPIPTSTSPPHTIPSPTPPPIPTPPSPTPPPIPTPTSPPPTA
ncbi:putative ribonuclease H-like domain-containing protein [Tanacetum coccineum]